MAFLTIGFDLDGTLVDSVYPHFLAVNILLQKCGKLPIKDLVVLRELNVDYKKFYQKLGIQTAVDELDKIFQPVFQLMVEEWMPLLFPEVEEVLLFLKKYGARLVLVTGQQKEIAQLYNIYSRQCSNIKFDFLDFFGSRNIFFVSHGGKESILKLIKQKEFNPRENIYIYISDTPDDLLAAQRAGWKVYGVVTGFSAKENLEKVIERGNGGIIQNLLELKSMFL